MDTIKELQANGAGAARDAARSSGEGAWRIERTRRPRIDPQDSEGAAFSPPSRKSTFASINSTGSRRCGWFGDGVHTSPSSSMLLSSVISLPRRLGDDTGHFQMASSFADDLMVRFAVGKVVGLPKPAASDTGLERLMNKLEFPCDFSAFLDHGLKTDGYTGREEDPLIGPSAFEDVVRAEGLGQDCPLDDDMIALAVALTIGHEGTHSRQWDKYPAVNLEGREEDLLRLPPSEREQVQRAHDHQKLLLEALAYQSEVFNLHLIRQDAGLPPGKFDQVRALLDVAICRRDEHLDALPGEVKSLLLLGSVDDAMRLVLDGVPSGWLVAPLSGKPWPDGTQVA